MEEGTTQVLDAKTVPCIRDAPARTEDVTPLTAKARRGYHKSGSSASRLIREIRKNTARRFDAEYKIKVVLEGFRKDIPITDLCRRERITPSLYYVWLKEFMEGGKARLKGATLREATKDETDKLREENSRLKELAGSQALELFLFKKRLLW